MMSVVNLNHDRSPWHAMGNTIPVQQVKQHVIMPKQSVMHACMVHNLGTESSSADPRPHSQFRSLPARPACIRHGMLLNLLFSLLLSHLHEHLRKHSAQYYHQNRYGWMRCLQRQTPPNSLSVPNAASCMMTRHGVDVHVLPA